MAVQDKEEICREKGPNQACTLVQFTRHLLHHNGWAERSIKVASNICNLDLIIGPLAFKNNSYWILDKYLSMSMSIHFFEWLSMSILGRYKSLCRQHMPKPLTELSQYLSKMQDLIKCSVVLVYSWMCL